MGRRGVIGNAVRKALSLVGLPLAVDLLLRRSVGGRAVPPVGDAPTEHQARAVYQATLAALRRLLAAEGVTDGQRLDSVDAFMAQQATAREAACFRQALANLDEAQRLEAMRHFMAADDNGKRDQLRALAQPAAIAKWLTDGPAGAHRRYLEALRPPMPAATLLQLLEFTDSLKTSEHLQFRCAIGRYPDLTERVAAITEIVNLPQSERFALARARGYITGSPVRAWQSSLKAQAAKAEGGLTALDEQIQARVTPLERALRDWSARLNQLGEGIKRRGGL
jgi:hypothetical protein